MDLATTDMAIRNIVSTRSGLRRIVPTNLSWEACDAIPRLIELGIDHVTSGQLGVACIERR
jgi:hypothetical protein